MDSNCEDLKLTLDEFFVYEQERQEEFSKKYPSDLPNNTCTHAFLRGVSIENSFEPKVGEYNYLFKTQYETVSIWTYKADTNSALVSEVVEEVKTLPFWKTAAYLIQLSLNYVEAFEERFVDDLIDYKWMYYFQHKTVSIHDIVFYGLSELESKCMSYGRQLKATDIANLSSIIELLNRDDRLYTALSLMVASFNAHYCCLICELSKNPWHDHLAEEPKIWQQASVLPKLEIAIVQACRVVESIIGEPPNKNKQSKLYQHKQHWIEILDINPDDIFEKANKSYLEFYYELFFDLRNPSAHSYGNIHYDLARNRTVESQCFAAIILRAYIKKNEVEQDIAIDKLQFNKELLSKVSNNMSTCRTK